MISDSKKKFFEKILTNSNNSKDTWRAINLATSENSYANIKEFNTKANQSLL